MRRFPNAIRVLSLTALAIGCSDPSSSELGTWQNRIVFGEVSDDTDNAVVRLIIPTQQSLCSGSLVAPNIVLTALHCVTHYDTFGSFGCSNAGTLTSTSPGGGELGFPVEPGDVHIHFGAQPDNVPDAYGFKIFGTNSTEICRNDLAFVVLDRELSGPLLPMRLERPTVRGEKMLIVGFGQTDQDVSQGRYRRSNRTVQDSNPDALSPGRQRTAPNTFILDQGACQGDSGGPAISEETGAIAGVYSISAGANCTNNLVRNVYTRLDPFDALADRAFDFAGATKMVEPPSLGTGGSGAEASGGNAGLGGGGSAEGGNTTTSGGFAGQGGGASSEQGGSGARGGSSNQSGGLDTDPGEGSGSRRDSSCACRVAGMRPGGAAGAAATLGIAIALSARRRRRARPER